MTKSILELTPDSSVSASISSAIRAEPFTLVTLIICFLGSLFVIGLCGYHTYLSLTNQTTNEHLKRVFKDIKQNPYSRNKIKNIWKIVCKPSAKSLLKLRGEIMDKKEEFTDLSKINARKRRLEIESKQDLHVSSDKIGMNPEKELQPDNKEIGNNEL